MLARLKRLLSPYADIIKYKEPLNRHTTFKIGGIAPVYINPRTINETQDVYALLNKNKIPLHFIGLGSNILIKDKALKGVVLKSANRGVKAIGPDLIVSAGYPLQRLVSDASNMGLSGLEPLVGIPGTVGGATIMNAGGKYGDFSRLIQSVWTIDADGKIKDYAKEELPFGYRTSGLRGQLVSDVIIRLEPSDSGRVRQRAKEILDEKRAAQPLSDWSAGCVFKNPANHSAGALIDHSGLKGKSIGGAQVSTKHANFIINTGEAKAGDVLKLINLIKRTVKRRFNIDLELEIEIW
jgi:UDP-N-acetylmuramate dehydrogenase